MNMLEASPPEDAGSQPRWPNLSRSGVVRQLTAWIAQDRPRAVVRFGEGEGRLLCAEPKDPDSMAVARRKLWRQTGRTYGDSDILAIKDMILRALDEADVVGIRGSAGFDAEHLMWVRRIEQVFAARCQAGRRAGYVTHCLVSNDIFEALPAMLQDQKVVSVVSCRDVQAFVAQTYGVQHVRQFQIPSQYVKRHVDDAFEAGLHGTPMWPDFYRRLYDEVTVRERGEVFLVGAGLFGKDLCVRIRDLGGIAIDLGSRLDAMAGKVTRGEDRQRPSPAT